MLAVGLAARGLTQLVPLPHVSVLFFAAVITSAAFWGLGPSLFAAVLSVAGGSFFFYSPIYSFHVANPQDFADLTVFVVAAVLVSRLAEGVRRQAREIAEARLRAQGEALREGLLNSVSHDLQTPLSSILGSATVLETLEERAEPRVRRELAATIREEAERLASYIGNLLDLTRVRSGQIAPRLELVELSDIVNGALRRKERSLAGRELRLALPQGLPMLRLDLFLMEHAVANLLDNAAKFSPPGSVVSVTARAEDGAVVLEIADVGRGVHAADRERVFEPFFRGGQPGAGATSGTGLGLAICRAFVEANAGQVALSSDGPGRGTRVQIRLPVPP